MDEDLARLYRGEERLGNLVGAFACIAVVIACLGLFGLASFTAERRTREIGIRKVLGASLPGIVRLLSGEFMGLVLLAGLLACPAAYYIMNGWLRNFAYRIDLGIATFILPVILTMAIALLTVGYRAVKAGLTDPAETLKYE